ncbi:MAG: hypothetical protein M3068_13220 [Gemmatimonadota bacterium]|nr:hypothetical protein [Gemmatimonadota bacterium]
MPIRTIAESSRATPAFKSDVLRFASAGAAERIQSARYLPAVKVARLLAQLLTTESHLEVERVRIEAVSGCSDFVGTIDVETPSGSHRFHFEWDCRWRAVEQGYTDYFGLPDQIRAAQEFGWRCFKSWSTLAG